MLISNLTVLSILTAVSSLTVVYPKVVPTVDYPKVVPTVDYPKVVPTVVFIPTVVYILTVVSDYSPQHSLVPILLYAYNFMHVSSDLI